MEDDNLAFDLDKTAYVFALLFMLGGWVANIVKLLSDGGMESMRMLGIFIPPLGAVLGFM